MTIQQVHPELYPTGDKTVVTSVMTRKTASVAREVL